jgi:DNA-directed RNA polymerase beta subunit
MDLIPAVPPLTRFTQEFVGGSRVEGDYLEYNEHGKLMRSYLAINNFGSPLINNFDNWVNNIIQKQIVARPINLPMNAGKIYFRNMILRRPTYVAPGSVRPERLLPRHCRDTGRSYSAGLFCNLEHHAPDGTVTLHPEITSLGEIPVMLGSSLCWTHGMSKEDLLAMGEDNRDPGTYFITKGGTEKIVLAQEKQRMSIPLLLIGKKGELICQMTCPTPRGTTLVVLTVDNDVIYLNTYFMEDDSSGKVISIPVSWAWIIFGYSPLDIWPFIESWIDPKYRRKAEQMFIPTYLKAADVGDVSQVKIAMMKKRVRSKEPPLIDEYGLDGALQRELFPFIDETDFDLSGFSPSEVVEFIRFRKLQMLSRMIAQILEHMIGKRSLTDRDSLANKRYDSAAPALQALFSRAWEKFVSDVEDELRKRGKGRSGKILEEVSKVLPTEVGELSKNLQDSLASKKWGVRGTRGKVREGMTDILERTTLMATLSHIYRINTPSSREGTNLAPRKLHPSQLGYICLAETPEGKGCGLVKNLAITCYPSLERDENDILRDLWPRIWWEGSPDFDIFRTDGLTKVLVNAKLLGWAKDGLALYKHCIEQRRSSKYDPDICIVLREGILEIYTDGSRPVRPLLVVHDGELIIEKKNMWRAPFPDLLSEGCVEYVDALEAETAYIARTRADVVARQEELAETAGKIEELEQDPEHDEVQLSGLKKALAFILDHPYSHCELDPNAMWGATGSLNPWPDKIHGPRTSYTPGMTKQATTVYHKRHDLRYDTSAKVLSFPAPALVSTMTQDLVGLDEQPNGETVSLCFLTFEGFNQEDGLIFRKGALDSGRFMYTYYSSYRSVAKSSEVFLKPKPNPGEDPEKYHALGDDGIPLVGSLIRTDDCIIGKVRQTEAADGTRVITNASTFAGVGVEGRVERVWVGLNQDGRTVVKVKIADYRRPQVGDKFAFRYSQKSTLARIVADKDLPFVVDSALGLEEGHIPDVFINPHSIPSRMTMGFPLEGIGGRLALLTGKRISATAFRESNIATIRRGLLNYGFNQYGDTTMVNGQTGQYFQAQIMTGYAYMQMLKHHVKDKFQVRGRGAVKRLTRQPPGGRRRRGAPKAGEMERDAFISHGATGIFMDRFFICSDATMLTVCKNCGTFAVTSAISDQGQPGYYCQGCHQKSQLGRISLPNTMKVLIQLMAGLSYNVKFRMEEVQMLTE